MPVEEKKKPVEENKTPVKEKRPGWLPEKTMCDFCNKTVVEKGGVYCGRKRDDGTYVGCFKAICWKCMNKGLKDIVGGIKTTKKEFVELGPGAWWMHEACMSAEDKKAYFGEEEDDDIGKPKDMDSDEEGDGKFAWE